MADNSEAHNLSGEANPSQNLWLPSKAFETLEIPLTLAGCEDILRRCAVWGEQVCARLEALDQAGAVCKEQLSTIPTNLQSNIQYLREKENGITSTDLEKVMAAAKSCFCHFQSSLQPELTEEQKSLPEVLSLRWGLYSDDLDKLMTASTSLLNELRHNVPTPWAKTGRRPYSANDDSVIRSSPAPPQLYISKINNYKWGLENIRDNLYPIKQLDQWINLSEISEWLRHCDEHHSHHCSFSSQSRGMFNTLPKRLIDVKEMCLVPSASGQRYAALSYVWGTGPTFKTESHNLDALYVPGSLSGDHQPVSTSGYSYNPSQLPNTLIHAISLTRELGIEYLWIDALCIVQDDEAEKGEQLTGMGSIYANAYVTLVAAGGTASVGLRGLQKVTPPMDRKIRKPPRGVWRDPDLLWREQVKEHVRRITQSEWSLRAWTFQEQIFSRRLLVLTHESVSWECHCAVWFEGVEALGSECQERTNTIAQGFSFRLPADFDDYAQHVRKYNPRKLTFSEDALRAFEGVLGVLSTAFVDGFVCGIPRMFFEHGLLWWLRKHPAQRRKPRDSNDTIVMPPTWCWAAWEGEIQFPVYRSHTDASPLVQWKYCAKVEDGWSTVVAAKGEESPSDILLEEPPDTLELAEHHRSHLLFARPERAYFRISFKPRGPIPWDDYWGAAVIGNDGVCVGKIKALGWINFDMATGEAPCELVAISESIEGRYYNVLWIEMQDGVALRKGVGRVWKVKWEEAERSRVDLLLR